MSTPRKPWATRQPFPEAITERVNTDEWMRRGVRRPHRADAADAAEADRIVRAFRAKRAVRGTIISGLGVGLLAIACGYIYALGGPPDNPVRKYLEGNGLLPGIASAKRAAEERVLSARKSYAHGDINDLERAIDDLKRARALAKDDQAIAADLGMALTAAADVHLRAAEDIEKEADGVEVAESAVKMRDHAAEERDAAKFALERAKEALAGPSRATPNAVATARALADYYRLSGDDGLARQWLARATATLAKDQAEDAWTIFVEARAVEGDVDRAKPEALEKASEILRRALAADPELWRARLELARIEIARGNGEGAEAELQPIVKHAPTHAEAQRLMRQVTLLRAENATTAVRRTAS